MHPAARRASSWWASRPGRAAGRRDPPRPHGRVRDVAAAARRRCRAVRGAVARPAAGRWPPGPPVRGRFRRFVEPHRATADGSPPAARRAHRSAVRDGARRAVARTGRADRPEEAAGAAAVALRRVVARVTAGCRPSRGRGAGRGPGWWEARAEEGVGPAEAGPVAAGRPGVRPAPEAVADRCPRRRGACSPARSGSSDPAHTGVGQDAARVPAPAPRRAVPDGGPRGGPHARHSRVVVLRDRRRQTPFDAFTSTGSRGAAGRGCVLTLRQFSVPGHGRVGPRSPGRTTAPGGSSYMYDKPRRRTR